MKFAIWTYTVAVALAALLSVALVRPFRNLFRDMLGGKPLPALTEWFLHLGWWPFLALLPFFVVAIRLSARPAITNGQAFSFAALATLFIVFLFAFGLLSLLLPFTTWLQRLQ